MNHPCIKCPNCGVDSYTFDYDNTHRQRLKITNISVCSDCNISFTFKHDTIIDVNITISKWYHRRLFLYDGKIKLKKLKLEKIKKL